MMDYYEELGIDRSASPDEIRQHYRQLVRVLHPDHCRDDQLRPLADLQMKRLNAILKILTDPRERELYDQSIATPVRLPEAVPAVRKPWPWFGPSAVGAAVLALVALMTYQPQPAIVQMAPSDPTAIVTPTPRKAPAHNPPAAAPRIVNRRTLPPQAPPPESDAPPFVPDFQAPSEDIAAIRLGAPNLESSVQPVGHSPPRPGLTGVWLLAPTPQSRHPGLYRPEYIELRLTEDSSGILRGRYRARYHIPDRAISPVVAFQFEGAAAVGRASLPWSGAGGATGEVELRLLTPGTLEINWVANRLSDALGLISGTATLVRKLD